MHWPAWPSPQSSPMGLPLQIYKQQKAEKNQPQSRGEGERLTAQGSRSKAYRMTHTTGSTNSWPWTCLRCHQSLRRCRSGVQLASLPLDMLGVEMPFLLRSCPNFNSKALELLSASCHPKTLINVEL